MVTLLILFVTALVTGLLTAVIKLDRLSQQELDGSFFVLAIEGFLAGLTVPLFLTITGSDILTANGLIDESGSLVVDNYLILLGLLVIVGLYSDGFLNKVSSKVIEGIEQANSKLSRAEQKLESHDELLTDTKKYLFEAEEIFLDDEGRADKKQRLNMIAREVLDVLQSAKTKYVKTIEILPEKHSQLEIEDALLELESYGFAQKISSYDAWYLTADGREA